MSTTRKPRAKARTNDSLTEMQLMHDQLAAAASRREVSESRAESPASDAPTADPTSAEPAAAEPEHDAEEQFSELREQFDELLEKLNQDLSEIPTATAIGMFALGVVVGRLLPR